MDDEEEALICVVCGEGYEFNPEGVLGEVREAYTEAFTRGAKRQTDEDRALGNTTYKSDERSHDKKARLLEVRRTTATYFTRRCRFLVANTVSNVVNHLLPRDSLRSSQYSYATRISIPSIGNVEGAPLFNNLPAAISSDADLGLDLVTTSVAGAGAKRRKGDDEAEISVRPTKPEPLTQVQLDSLSALLLRARGHKKEHARLAATPSKTLSTYSTVSAANCIHMACHSRAVAADRSNAKAVKSEWEGSQLRNSRVKTNIIVPLLGYGSVRLVAVISVAAAAAVVYIIIVLTHKPSQLFELSRGHREVLQRHLQPSRNFRRLFIVGVRVAFVLSITRRAQPAGKARCRRLSLRPVPGRLHHLQQVRSRRRVYVRNITLPLPPPPPFLTTHSLVAAST